MQPKTLVDTLAATLSEMDVKTIGDTLGCVETRILVKRLAFKLAGAEATTLQDTQGGV